MANADLIGKQVTFGPDEVTESSILEFGVGINDETPAHTDPGADAFRAHPLYCARAVIPGTGGVLFQKGAQFDVNRIVHAGIDIHFPPAAPPLGPGEKLGASAALREVEEKESGTLVHIDFKATTEGGDIVADGISRYFIRGKKKGGAAKEAPVVERQAIRFERQVPTLDDQSLLYAKGSGDSFPIHTDDSFAKMVGLPGVIMHGMCTLALGLNATVAEVASSDWSRVRSLSCRFSKMVLPGETLKLVAFEGGEGEVPFEILNAKGEVAISEGLLLLS